MTEVSVNHDTIPRASRPAAHQFWSGRLTTYRENGVIIREAYVELDATLLADESGDYFTYDILPSEKQLDHFYTNVYPATRRENWYNAKAQYVPERWSSIVRQVCGLVAPRDHDELAPPVRVHDVGCGFGGLVQSLTDLGFDAIGRDLSREAVEGGRAYGNERIFQGSIEVLERFPPQDIIVMHHVIEHAIDPLALIRAAHCRLVPGGRLVVRCPNSRYIRSRL